MQVKTDFKGKPPKLRWGYKLFFPVLKVYTVDLFV